jgi:hypothetical protein
VISSHVKWRGVAAFVQVQAALLVASSVDGPARGAKVAFVGLVQVAGRSLVVGMAW